MKKFLAGVAITAFLASIPYAWAVWTATHTNVADADMILFQDDSAVPGSQDGYVTFGSLSTNYFSTKFTAYDVNMITWPSAITADEIGYLDGLGGTLVSLLGAKAPTLNATFTGTFATAAGAIQAEAVEAALKTNTIEWVYADVSEIETGKQIRIPTGATWESAYSWCDGAEAVLVYTLYQATTLGGTFASLGTIPHNATATTDTIDISTFTDPALGYWVRLDISTAGTVATACTLAITLTTN